MKRAPMACLDVSKNLETARQTDFSVYFLKGYDSLCSDNIIGLTRRESHHYFCLFIFWNKQQQIIGPDRVKKKTYSDQILHGLLIPTGSRNLFTANKEKSIEWLSHKNNNMKHNFFALFFPALVHISVQAEGRTGADKMQMIHLNATEFCFCPAGWQ